MREAISTPKAPPPAGTYSQAIVCSGTMVFIAGQTPRLADGTRIGDVSFEDQARQALDNLSHVAQAAGGSLRDHWVKSTVYLSRLEDRFVFDKVFVEYVGACPPARAIVQSNFIDFDVEIDAVLCLPFARDRQA